MCAHGYNGSPGTTLGCSDINECSNNPCGFGAVCKNEPGSYMCECPNGFDVNPSREGCVEVKSPGCDASSPCPQGESCVRDEQLKENVCICQNGFVRDQSSSVCRDMNECIENNGQPTCGIRAICKNVPGSYECSCPPTMVGNPFSECKRKYFIIMYYLHKIECSYILSILKYEVQVYIIDFYMCFFLQNVKH